VQDILKLTEELESDLHLSRLEEDEIAMAALAVEAVSGILISVVGNFVTDGLKNSGSRGCITSFPPIWTGGENINRARLAGCQRSDIRWYNGAHLEKTYGVHRKYIGIANLLAPSQWKCEFQFSWQFRPTQFYDCTGSNLAPHERGVYVDAEIVITKCQLMNHIGYVRMFPSLPESTMSFDSKTKLWAPKPKSVSKFHINVEGWTFGECSGMKAPGVRWMFTYEVDLVRKAVTYVTVMKSTPAGGSRPTLSERTFIKVMPDMDPTYVETAASANGVTARWIPWEPYKENSAGFSKLLGMQN
jgi:hypothetical protein